MASITDFNQKVGGENGSVQKSKLNATKRGMRRVDGQTFIATFEKHVRAKSRNLFNRIQNRLAHLIKRISKRV